MFTNIVVVSARVSKEPVIKEYSHEGKELLTFDIAIKSTDRNRSDFFLTCVVFGGEKRLNYFKSILKCGMRYIFQATLFDSSYEKNVADQKVKIPQISLNVFDIGLADKFIDADEENILQQLNEGASYGGGFKDG